MIHRTELPNFRGILEKVIGARPIIGRVESLKFFRDRFIKQGWEDTAFQPWVKSQHPFMGKRTLLNSNSLMNSLKVQEETASRVVIINDKEYAEPNNEGATITVTERMKKYFWRQYSIHSGNVSRFKNGNIQRDKENKKTNAKAEFCRKMAMKPLGSKIKIPSRRFMGNSKKMMGNMESVLIKYIDRNFKNIQL